MGTGVGTKLGDMTVQDLEGLADRIAAGAGRACAERLLEADQEMAAAAPPSELEAVAGKVLALLPSWAEEASRVSRVGLPKQAELLTLAKEYRLKLAESQASGEGQEQPGRTPT